MAASATRNPEATARILVVVMGVSGCGKSTIATGLAQALQRPFLEADTLHSAHNVAKMRRGEPLDDADRAPWLDAVGAALADTRRYPLGLITTCSALKRSYRDRLRSLAPGLRFLFLEVSIEVVTRRLRSRPHHFMPPTLLPSQFAALERPGASETDTVTIDANGPPSGVLDAALAAVRSPPAR